jgi:hypothetical protein
VYPASIALEEALGFSAVAPVLEVGGQNAARTARTRNDQRGTG